MASIVVAGDTSGTVTLTAPAVSGTTTLTLPTTNGTLVTTASGQTLTSPTIATPTITGQATIPTINLTGGQITFPATQSASADANTLDDYEEGTWTPTIVNGGGTISGTGRYIKVGRIVQFSIDAQLGGTRNGNVLTIGGLPFVNVDWTACSFYCQQYFPEGTQQASGFIVSTASELRVQNFGADAVGTDFGNGYANWAGTYAAQ
jgi:hypothetical protein